MMIFIHSKYCKCLSSHIWIANASGFNYRTNFITLEQNINKSYPVNFIILFFITLDLSSDSKVEVVPLSAILFIPSEAT